MVPEALWALWGRRLGGRGADKEAGRERVDREGSRAAGSGSRTDLR